MWQSSLGRFSQIWLQANYENVLLKKFFYILANLKQALDFSSFNF
jgi:hypothetical protein